MSGHEVAAPAAGAADSSELVLSFTGAVRCERSTSPLGLALIGPIDHGQWAHLALQGRAPEDLPPRVENLLVYRTPSGSYRLVSGDRSWSLTASALFLHRDVGAAFYRAIPPRPASFTRRMLWHALLLVAASAPGRRWLERRSAK